MSVIKKQTPVVIMVMVLIFNIFAGSFQKNIVHAASNEEIIFNFCRTQLNFNTAASCAVLANIKHESSFNPTCSVLDTNNKTSYGICQWNGERFDNLKKWCSNNGLNYSNIDAQLKFLKHELETNVKPGVYNYMRTSILDNSSGAYNAGIYWAAYFEVCAVKYREQRGITAKNEFWPKYQGVIPNSFPGEEDTSCSVPIGAKAIEKCNTYDLNGNVESKRWIDAGDECTIEKVYKNGFVYVEYPSMSEPGGKRKAFAEKKYFSINNPVILDGNVEFCEGGAGTVRVSGWAYNAANTSQRVDVHFYLGGESGGNLGLGTALAQNDRGDGTFTGYDVTFWTTERGTFYVWMAIINPNGTGDAKWSRSNSTVTITEPDTEGPKIGKVSFSHIDKEKFRVEIDVTDNVGITKIQVPVWSHDAPDGNWQDDLVWHEAVKYTDTHWYCDVYVKDHKYNYGRYAVDVYAYDAAGNKSALNGENGGRSTVAIGEFKLTYDPNGGKAGESTAAQTQKENDPKLIYSYSNYASLAWLKPERTGYTFNGWYDAKTGGIKVYGTDGKCVNEGKYWKDNKYQNWGNLNVYAQWTAKNYTVKFDANGGTADKGSLSAAYGSKIGTLPSAKQEGYIFTGWYKAKDGNEKITAEEVIKGDAIYYAHWIKTAFKGNGTAESPYLIETAEDLVKLAEVMNDITVNPYYSFSCYRQTADIDLEGVKWTPIGVYLDADSKYQSSLTFRGIYDGNYHK
ncbi:MAG: phage tail tip lysozyme, partial [Oscillospiraceae bacterium]|nr:phage tail tip lysozyme [Oscillospiraceae bacterium]